LTKVDDDLCCSGVERVEVGAMLAIQALHREVVDAPQALHQFPTNRECVTDLDLRSEMIIFESLLTIFEGIDFFEAAGAVLKIDWKPNDHNQVNLVQFLVTH